MILTTYFCRFSHAIRGVRMLLELLKPLWLLPRDHILWPQRQPLGRP